MDTVTHEGQTLRAIADAAPLELVVPSARGRKAAPFDVCYARDLNAADLELLGRPPELGVKTSALKQTRDSHHLLARLLADGKSGTECSYITGYSISRISILKSDPMFRELVVYYQEQKGEIYCDVHQRIATVALDALGEIQERLEDRPETFQNKELMALAEMGFDRTIAPSKGAKGQNPQGQSSGPLALTVTFVAPSARSPAPQLEGVAVTVEGRD